MSGCEKIFTAELGRQACALQDAAKRQIGVSDFQGNSLLPEFFMQAVERFSGGDINVGDGLRIKQEPANRRWAGGSQLADALDEITGIGKQQWSIESVGDETRHGLHFHFSEIMKT